MVYRNIRDKATGQWVNVLFTRDADEFSVKAESHLASVAVALGVNSTSLEAVDSDADQRSGVLIAQGRAEPTLNRQTRQELVTDDLVDEFASLITTTDTQKASLRDRVLALVRVN